MNIPPFLRFLRVLRVLLRRLPPRFGVIGGEGLLKRWSAGVLGESSLLNRRRPAGAAAVARNRASGDGCGTDEGVPS